MVMHSLKVKDKLIYTLFVPNVRAALCSASGAAAAALPVRTDFYPEIHNTNNKKR